MGWNAHLPTWPGEQVVVFSAAFSHAGFEAARALRQLVAGDGEEKFVEELALATGMPRERAYRAGKLMQAVERAFEGNRGEANMEVERSALHEQAH